MKSENEPRREAPSEIHFGDVVLLDLNKSLEKHVIVGVSNRMEGCCDTAKLYFEKDGTEALTGPGGVETSKIAYIEERWDVERVVRALGNGSLLRAIPKTKKNELLNSIRVEAAERPSRRIQP